MPKVSPSDQEMRLRLLQEAVWNNGDKLTRILEHTIAYEAQLIRLARRIEQILNQTNERLISPRKTRRRKNVRRRS
ncbi:MAG: hypothetical protein AB1861_16870 [Cyanobacteriota bacterium]